MEKIVSRNGKRESLSFFAYLIRAKYFLSKLFSPTISSEICKATKRRDFPVSGADMCKFYPELFTFG